MGLQIILMVQTNDKDEDGTMKVQTGLRSKAASNFSEDFCLCVCVHTTCTSSCLWVHSAVVGPDSMCGS